MLHLASKGSQTVNTPSWSVSFMTTMASNTAGNQNRHCWWYCCFPGSICHDTQCAHTGLCWHRTNPINTICISIYKPEDPLSHHVSHNKGTSNSNKAWYNGNMCPYIQTDRPYQRMFKRIHICPKKITSHFITIVQTTLDSQTLLAWTNPQVLAVSLYMSTEINSHGSNSSEGP